jgi:eukaryotic-like serine/threonine-protein kinase
VARSVASALEIRDVLRLSAGGLGAVWLGLAGRRPVAVKRPHEHLAADARVISLYQAEGELLERLHHESLGRGLGRSRDGLVMEYVHGPSLAFLLDGARQNGTTLGTDLAVALALDLLSGLEALHAAGIAHADLSPQNALVGSDGLCRIIDLGLARPLGSRSAAAGTVAYAAPETLTDGLADERSDLFGVGVLFWETARQERLHRGRTEPETMLRITTEDAPGLDDGRDDLRPYAAFARNLLARRADERFPRAAEARAALLAVHGDPPRRESVARTVLRVVSKELERRERALSLALYGTATATDE